MAVSFLPGAADEHALPTDYGLSAAAINKSKGNVMVTGSRGPTSTIHSLV